MRRQKRHGPQAIDHPLHPHRVPLGRVARRQVGHRRRPPYPRQPAREPRDRPHRRLERPDRRRHPRRPADDLHRREGGHAQTDHQIQRRGRQHSDELRAPHQGDQPDDQEHPERAYRRPRRPRALPQRLHPVCHQRRQDQPRQRDIRRQQDRHAGDHQHRHRETDHPLDQPREQRRGTGDDERGQTHEGEDGIHARTLRAPAPPAMAHVPERVQGRSGTSTQG